MKYHAHAKDISAVESFLSGFVEDEKYVWLLCSEESDPLYFDGDENVLSIFAEMERIGFVEVAKAVFQGSHPYRSDCGKCPRCYRCRPEIHWNNENLKDGSVCNRCLDVMEEDL